MSGHFARTMRRFLLRGGIATLLLLLVSPVGAAPLCDRLDAARQSYALADLNQAEELLNDIPDTDLNPVCQAEKHQLLGAINVVRFYMGEVASLDSADRSFFTALLVDPFQPMSEGLFPARMVQHRFEYNRRKLRGEDLVAVDAPIVADLETARRDAVATYVSQYFTPDQFDLVISDTELAEAMLSVDYATESTTNGHRNFIDKDRILAQANEKGLLFNIEKPLIQLDIRETINGTVSASSIALTRAKQVLQTAGFTVLDETAGTEEAHILIRGHVDAAWQAIGSNGSYGAMGFGGSATANLTLRWADGSAYEFGSTVLKADGEATSGRREAALLALEAIAGPIAESIKTTSTEAWNDRQVNGAMYLVELVGDMTYADFKRVMAHLSTFALSDPTNNPRYEREGITRLYFRWRAEDGDLAEMIQAEHFPELSQNYNTEVQAVGFNHLVIQIGLQP